jgi:peptidoglycan/LPS O-acetylase OafA/YrhL
LFVPSTLDNPPLSFSARLLAPYRRITSTGQFIPEIDGLRFFAIFSVFIYHLAGDILRHSPPGLHASLDHNWLFSVTQILNIGVPLFFVISGFILGMPFAASHLHRQRAVPLKKYFLRRLTRLEPPYIICLLLFFALKVVAARGSASELFPNLMASIFYVHNLAYGTPSVINFVAWSLEVEIQFYILAPILALVFAISKPSARRAVLAVLLLLATGISRLVAGNGALEHSLLGFAQYFLAGFLLTEFYLFGGEKRQANWLWDLISAAGWVILLTLLVRGGAPIEWIGPWLILVLYIAAFHSVAMNWFVTNVWITTIGGMCYTIYLLHNYLVAGTGMLTERVLPEWPFAARLLVQFVLISPVVLGVSALYFRWIERPCMRPDWPQRVLAALARLKTHRFWTSTAAESVSSGEYKP